MIAIKNKHQNKTLTVVIVLQLLSCFWFLLPFNNHTHVPRGFIKMVIFGVIILFLLIVAIIFNFIFKPTELLWKIPFVIFIIMVLLGWFYNRY